MSTHHHQTGLFFQKDMNGASSTTTTARPTAAFFLLLFCVPLCLVVSWSWGLSAFLAAMVLATCNAVQDIQEEDKQEIRYNVLDAHKVLQEMVEWEKEILLLNNDNDKNSGSTAPQLKQTGKGRLVISVGLNALAKKYGKQQALLARRRDDVDDDDDDDTTTKKKSKVLQQDPDLALWCQQAAYIGLNCFPADDGMVASSISLLALAAKDVRVKERHLYEADKFGFNVPIQALFKALDRAKDVDDDEDDDENDADIQKNRDASSLKREQQCAELQRKGCLLLGALASASSSSSPDISAEIAAQVVQEGGLDVILQAVDWYRHHADLANWALWAIFTLCFENDANKVALVQQNGVHVVLQTLQNLPKSVQVARHGVAILFDLMREEEDDDNATNRQRKSEANKLDVWKIRSLALDAGLHEILVKTMTWFSGEMDIMMMGQEMLIGTGYRGDIPQFDPLRGVQG